MPTGSAGSPDLDRSPRILSKNKSTFGRSEAMAPVFRVESVVSLHLRAHCENASIQVFFRARRQQFGHHGAGPYPPRLLQNVLDALETGRQRLEILGRPHVMHGLQSVRQVVSVVNGPRARIHFVVGKAAHIAQVVLDPLCMKFASSGHILDQSE